MSELALRLIEENKRTKDTFLDLGHCGLENELPEELLECIWLKELNLGGAYTKYEPYEIIESPNSGEYNEFHGSELYTLNKLPQLEALHLLASSITDISFLQNLKHLSSLDISLNSIRNSSLLKNTTQLRSLVISYTQIAEISF